MGEGEERSNVIRVFQEKVFPNNLDDDENPEGGRDACRVVGA